MCDPYALILRVTNVKSHVLSVLIDIKGHICDPYALILRVTYVKSHVLSVIYYELILCETSSLILRFTYVTLTH